MTTLSPCPFCGGEARFGQSSPTEDNDYAGAEYIECINARCFATTACMFPCMQDVKPLLAERWNKRAAHEQARGQPEDLLRIQVRQADERGDAAMERAHVAEAALVELVALKDLKDEIQRWVVDDSTGHQWPKMQPYEKRMAASDDYERRAPIAWANARAALAGAGESK